MAVRLTWSQPTSLLVFLTLLAQLYLASTSSLAGPPPPWPVPLQGGWGGAGGPVVPDCEQEVDVALAPLQGPPQVVGHSLGEAGHLQAAPA